MLTIGVRELKARLSQILREVQRGEIVLVTDRGRVVAELRQPGLGSSVPESPDDRALARLAAEGHLRLAERPPSGYPRSPIRSPAGTALRLLDAERGER